MPDFDVGDLCHRITWERNTRAKTPTSAGQMIDNWTSLGTYWGKVEPISGRELWTARQLQATTTHRIIVREIGAIQPRDRFLFLDSVYGTRYLYVDTVYRLDELNEFLVIEASEPKDHA